MSPSRQDLPFPSRPRRLRHGRPARGDQSGFPRWKLDTADDPPCWKRDRAGADWVPDELRAEGAMRGKHAGSRVGKGWPNEHKPVLAPPRPGLGTDIGRGSNSPRLARMMRAAVGFGT